MATNQDNKELILSTKKDSKSNKGLLVYELKGAIDTGDSTQIVSGEGIYTEIVKKDFENIKKMIQSKVLFFALILQAALFLHLRFWVI
ncbi:hypothetical protein HC766_02705 [Candidatus Gracilibacteria bacterium]|nr:hypothetical protein [Candidatus Gracilibacteria bacterium]